MKVFIYCNLQLAACGDWATAGEGAYTVLAQFAQKNFDEPQDNSGKLMMLNIVSQMII